MKLLSPIATQDAKGQEAARDILRAEEAKNVEREWRIRMAKAEADFAIMLKGQRMRWEQEEKNHQQEIVDREKEMQALETKKLNLLVPFDILKEGTDDRMKEAKTFMQSLYDRESRAEDLIELFEDKLDDVSDRESIVSRRESLVTAKECGIEQQQAMTQEGSEKLSKKIEDFLNQKEKDEKEIDARKRAVFLTEISLQAKQDSLNSKENDLVAKERRLADERGVLDRAWKELERKKAS